MATTYSKAKTVLDEVAQRIIQNRKRLADATQTIAIAVSDLAAMAPAYSAVIADVKAAAEADPKSGAYQMADSEATLLVAEFQALKTEATAMKDALAAL